MTITATSIQDSSETGSLTLTVTPPDDVQARYALRLPGDAQWSVQTSLRAEYRPKTFEGLERIRKAATQHGRYSKEANTERCQFRALPQEWRDFLIELSHVREP